MKGLASAIGLRYAWSGGANRYLSFVSLVSLLSLYLSVVALIAVVSVMNGFDRELKERILGVVPHLAVQGLDAAQTAALTADQRVHSASRFLEVKGLILGARQAQLVQVYGVDTGAQGQPSLLAAKLDEGWAAMAANPRLVYLGRALGRRLGVKPGQQISLVLPEVKGGNRVVPKLVKLTLGGYFDLGATLDYSLAVMDVDGLAMAADLVPGHQITLQDVFDADRLAQAWRQQGLAVASWTQEHGDFFQAVKMEKIMMFLLLSFVVAVASFGIVSGLGMMVDAKRGDIAVLMTMGFPVGGVMLIFIAQGMCVALAGILAGVATGIPIALSAPEIMAGLAQLTGVSLIEGTYFDAIPVDVRLPDLLVILALATLISFLATLYPSWKAAQVKPSVTLRYE